MKVIKITNGEVHIKDFCTRKLRKEINRVLFGNVQVKGGESGSNFEGFSMEDMDKANDVALLGMVEKLIINDQEMPIEIKTFDEMDVMDTEKIINEINKITGRQVPNA